MEEKKNPQKTIKFVIRPTRPAVKILLIVLIVLSMVSLLALRMVHSNFAAETQRLRDEAAYMEQANSVLDQRLRDPDSVQTVQAIAREELGLVDPDTVVINPQD